MSLIKRRRTVQVRMSLFIYICSSIFAGTASVALAGLLAAQRAVGKPITEHRVLFLGAGEVRK